MTTDDVAARFANRDPLLMVALYSGDASAAAAVSRMLRLTPLHVLARTPAALVDVLAALPELHDRLRHTWGHQDPALTATLFGWVEQARLHIRRGAHGSSRAQVVASTWSEELALAG